MDKWDWGLFQDAESFLNRAIANFMEHNESASTFSSNIERATSTRIFDWIDHLKIPRDYIDFDEFAKLGFVKMASKAGEAFLIKGSTFFPIVSSEKNDWELALSVENIDHFSSYVPSSMKKTVLGAPYSSLRRMTLKDEGGFVLSAMERRGCPKASFESEKNDIADYMEALSLFNSRSRTFNPKIGSEEEGLKNLESLVARLSRRLSPQRVADAFFRAERSYWASRTYVGRVQKLRQDALGLGWGNIDHHTFRSSRRNFSSLVRIFKNLGMELRERFYAGAQAGWGAQILEDPVCGHVVFADVDLAEDETFDFSIAKLPDGEEGGKKELGTVGLWVALNGESILQAGMHHLAARYRFDALRENLKEKGIGMMKPFSNFSFLKQAFSQIEYREVNQERAKALARRGLISEENLKKFLADGVIGSHLESIERNQGFKGFNQDSVSVIIRMTDPRAMVKEA
jgi:hypothetical protein